MMEDLQRAAEKHRAGQKVWKQAELGEVGQSMVSRVARLLARRGPPPRTEIVNGLDEIPRVRSPAEDERPAPDAALLTDVLRSFPRPPADRPEERLLRFVARRKIGLRGGGPTLPTRSRGL